MRTLITEVIVDIQDEIYKRHLSTRVKLGFDEVNIVTRRAWNTDARGKLKVSPPNSGPGGPEGTAEAKR